MSRLSCDDVRKLVISGHREGDHYLPGGKIARNGGAGKARTSDDFVGVGAELSDLPSRRLRVGAAREANE